MSPTQDLERLEAERQAADHRYNEALTQLDRAIVALSGDAWKDRNELLHFGTALAVFLQQITGFVESKERRLGADLIERLDSLRSGLGAIAELRMQLAVVQRATEMLRRHLEPAPAQARAHGDRAGVALEPAAHVDHGNDYKYVAFEDHFRGSADEIRTRLAVYVPLYAGAANIVDIGCGRGEFLSALKEAGISGRGVDLNREMVAIARERGIDAAHDDALAYLSRLDDASIGGLMASQVVEHLDPRYLVTLLEVASRKLKPGAAAVIETINPACWLAFFSSYIRDLTHVRPVHPETLEYLLRASGFERVEIRYAAPVPDSVKMRSVNLPAQVLNADDPSAAALRGVAQACNHNMAILNHLMFTHLDYAAIGYRS
jgi:O-antigen chain-terminating methyltransferase